MHQLSPEKTTDSVFHAETSESLIFCVPLVGKSSSNVLPKILDLLAPDELAELEK